MKLELLEKYQVLVYLAAIAFGLSVGALWPHTLEVLELTLWPMLGLLLYTTFTQVPLTRLGAALTDSRYMRAALIGNFMLLPLIAWALSSLAPDEPAVRLGVLLVLLVPCTDWVIAFTHLGGGDSKRAIAFSPISLALQIILLPFYLWLFLDAELVAEVAHRDMLWAFVSLILLPLIAAYVTQRVLKRRNREQRLLNRLAYAPVPLLTLVVFAIAATQVDTVTGSPVLFAHLLLIFSAFLIIAALLAWLLARYYALTPPRARALAYSFGTRNSFVVLPIALALPASFELAVVAVVFQSLVELIGMAIYLWWVPRHFFPSGE